MIFEGSEKKLELVVQNGVDLLAWPEERWMSLVEAARTQVLSKIENSDCRAYLLSESSLFVWRDRITMITCGTTTLADAALKACSYLKPEEVAAVFYERKNEYFPLLQKSDFFVDARKLNEKIAGKAYRMGHVDEHHLFLFHSCKEFTPKKTDTTLEILMYGLQGRARDVFNTPGQTAEWIREHSGVANILSGFTVDDYAFQPVGYSLNAIKGPRYYTIHVTPQDESPYVSFETNLGSRADIAKCVSSVLEVFQPRAFDIVYFDAKRESEILDVKGFSRRSSVRESLNCGFHLHHSHHSQTDSAEMRAFVLDI